MSSSCASRVTWIVSKQCLMRFLDALIILILLSIFLYAHNLDRLILKIPTSALLVRSDHYCETTLPSLCKLNSNNSCCTIILAEQQGRLGNRMFMFASAFGIALTYSCQLVVDERILDELRSIFIIDSRQITRLQSLEISQVRSCADRKYNYCTYFPLTFHQSRHHIVELTGFWQSYKYFTNYERLIKKQFRFRTSIKKKVARFYREQEKKYINFSTQNQNGSSILRSNWKAEKTNLTWVGIHVRRGDFLYLRQVSSVHFIAEAMDYFEKKYYNVVFVIASDDKSFCKTAYGHKSNVVITSVSFSNGEDLAALSTCHHMIVTVGTFGWWAGFLVTGEVLHDMKFSKYPTPLDSNCSQKDYLPPSFSFFNKTF